MNGTSAEIAGAVGSNGSCGIATPSTTGLKAPGRRTLAMPASTSSTGKDCSLPASEGCRPKTSSKARAALVACSRVACFSAAPLSAIARWNSPLAEGMAIRVETFPAPPDSPKMVTLPGSPPKRAMLSWTQRRAATQSNMPALPEPAKAGPISSSR